MSFGSYVQEIHETNPTNTTTPRTLGVISLQALYTSEGEFEFMYLLTRKIISHHNIIHLPITQEVIDVVEALFKKDGIKFPLTSKENKEGGDFENYDEINDENDSIAVVDNVNEEYYEPTIEYDIKYNK